MVVKQEKASCCYTLGDGVLAGLFDGGIAAGIFIQNSNHNVINHVFAGGGGGAGILLDNSADNLVFNTDVQGDPYGIRVRWNSPNNVIERNLIATDLRVAADLFQGTLPNTAAGCNGDYWANNTHTNGNFGVLIGLSFNQPRIGQQQSLSMY
jgi:hypothetical protein